MSTFALLFTLSVLSPLHGFPLSPSHPFTLSPSAPVVPAQEVDAAEGAVIESAEILGLPPDQISSGLRRAIDGLVGTPLNFQSVSDLAARIEGEHPEMIVAPRSIARPDGRARVVFVLAPMSGDPDVVANINARYVVESVSIEGVPESRLSPELRRDLQDLVGDRLDAARAEQLRQRLDAELPGHRVRRRIARGSQPGRIRVIFDVETRPWIAFGGSRSKFIYHGDFGWTGALDLAAGGRHHLFGVGLIFGDTDELVEHYRGYRLRAQSRSLGNGRFGAGIEFSWLRETWETSTLDALTADGRIPQAYRTRRAIEPSFTFAFSPHVRATGGISATRLGLLSGAPETQSADAIVASIGYDQQWRAAGVKHAVEASYRLRATSDGLGSDLVYKRHLTQAKYRYDEGASAILATFAFGAITGQAPLFERFSLGNSTTLRGWNRFDLAPAGGSRMFHQSVEYRYHHVALFLDSGSVWEPGADKRVRFSTGFGVHAERAFLTIGFPLNADATGATFMMGVRF